MTQSAIDQPTTPDTPVRRKIRIDITAGEYQSSVILEIPPRLSWRLCRMLLQEHIALDMRDRLDDILTGIGVVKLDAGKHRPL